MSRIASASLVLIGLSLLASACEKSPPEIVGGDPKAAPGKPSAGAGVVGAAAGTPAEPVTGPIDLKVATEGVPGSGSLHAEITTDQGTLDCKLFDDKAPKTVANFVGLARGLQSFQDPNTSKWVKRPAYDGTTFHRIIKGFMIQGGDPTGRGTGDPGYTFPDEIWTGHTHDRAGLLCMANKGPNTNGMQFFITDAPTPHLDKLGHTIFGECSPVDTVHKLASTPTGPGDKPMAPLTILKVSVSRKSDAAPAPAASESASAMPAASASAAPSASVSASAKAPAATSAALAPSARAAAAAK